MTISRLEKANGVPRSTTCFYVREGMSPTAQKTAAGRAVNSEEHLVLLKEIARLNGEDLPLVTIKERMVAESPPNSPNAR